MSRPSVSPYRRNAYNNPHRGTSPYREEPYKLAEVPAHLAQKSKLSHSYIADPTAEKRQHREEVFRNTEKKRQYEPAIQMGQGRLDTLLEQNKYLLGENNELSNLLNERSRIIIALEQKLEAQIAQEVHTLQEIEYEKNRFLEEYTLKMREHSLQNERLMDEIAELNEDLYQLEVKKNKEIERLKDAYQRDHKINLDNIISAHEQTVDILQIENSKLKDEVSDREKEIERMAYELKSTTDRLTFKCDDLEKNLAHALHMKKLELSEQKMEFEKRLEEAKREASNEQQVASALHEAELRKIKKDLVAKQIQSDKLALEISSDKVGSQMQINDLQQRKVQLEDEITNLELFQKTLIFNETQRIKDLAHAELTTAEATHAQLIDGLKKENQKLQAINHSKNTEIERLRQNLEELRAFHESECRDMQEQIERMRGAIQEEREDEDIENEALKTKFAQLRSADMRSLQEYYQNELATMAQDLEQKELIIGENREKVHQQIQEKARLRKEFQIEESKLKARIGELELRIAGVIHEKREEIANFGSQMELTSMSLLRTAEEKQKYAAHSQSEKQRLKGMIASKDTEIEGLNEKIQLMQANHSKQIADKDEEISILKKTIDQLESNLKKEKFFLENELKKRETLHKNDREFYESQISRVKRESSQEYNQMLESLNNEKNYIESERVKLKETQKQLQIEIANISEAREQETLEREMALHHSQSRLETEKGRMEVTLSNFYQNKIRQREKEIADLKQQVEQLNADIRGHLEKEKKLSDKLEKLLESQEKLREMEQRVMVMGQENNLVKNLAEIVKNRKR